MPLGSFLCEVTGEEVSFAHCLRCARERHPCQFTEELLEDMAQSADGRQNAGISVTTITGCLRQGYYSLAYDYAQYPHLLWPAIRGTAFHRLVESHPSDNATYERRYARDLSGPAGESVTLTGQPDKVVPSEGLIVDFKSKDKVPSVVPEAYVWQVNGYRLILEDGYELATRAPVQIEITRLGIVWLTMMEVRKALVEVKPLDEVREYFTRRALQIQEALAGGKIPPRAYEAPELSSFCTTWCPFYRRCQADGA